MSREHLETYLNDHLAGSVAAVELLEHLETEHAATELRQFFAKLRTEVEADQQELKEFIDRLGFTESVTRKASAWLAGKVAQLKLRIDDASKGELHLFESLEFLSLGIEGKRSLWQALAAAAETSPGLQLDFARLIQRAEEQRSRVDEQRLVAARKALQTS